VRQFFFETEKPREARGFIHKKAFGALKRGLGIVLDVAPSVIPGGGIVRDGLKIGKGFLGGGGQVAIPQIGGFPQQPFPPIQLPPTPTITTPAERSLGVEFQAVTGAFGMPAMAPFAVQRTVLDCPDGMVLGKDDLCYPSAVLRRNSQFRKWRSAPRPTVTRRDERALARIDSVQKALKRLGKKAGLKVTG